MSEGVGLEMMNRKSLRVLITIVLAAAVFTAIGSEALAAGKASRPTGATMLSASQLSKPGTGPMAGEPDVPGNGGPLPPKTGSYPTGGQISPMLLQVQWLIRTWFSNVPIRFP